MSSKIQWTDVTDNIIKVKGGGWWCRMISPGCANCYAAKLNQNSFFGGNKMAYAGKPPEMILRWDIIYDWAKQRKPKRHFVCSMTDVFGDWVPRSWIFEFMNAMEAAPLQTFQVLTKRSDVMLESVGAWIHSKERGANRGKIVPRNIWLGVSVENRAALSRLNHLMLLPAIRFASFEPLLEDLQLENCYTPGLRGKIISTLHWAIVGGESGAKARPCNVDWIRGIVRECKEQSVAVFVKQLGSRIAGDANEFYVYQAHYPDGNKFTTPIIGGNAGKCPAGYESFTLNDKKGGTMSSWPADLKVREFPKT